MNRTISSACAPAPGARRPRYPVGSSRHRRGGAVLVYVVLSLGVLLGICALVVDLGSWYVRKADMQKASDAAAMAGAAKLAMGADASVASATALQYTRDNGYENGANRVTVTTSDDAAAKRFTVVIRKPEPTFFGGILGFQGTDVGSRAVASYQKISRVLVPITGRNYGLNSGPINIGLYGPDQVSARGDRYSAKYKLINGVVSLNPDYRPDGYNFQVTLPTGSAFGPTASLQIYDPDSYDSGVDATAAGKQWDEDEKEYYDYDGKDSKGKDKYSKKGQNVTTVTRFTLYSDAGTPADFADDTQIDSREYGNDASTDKKWDNAFALQVAAIKASRPDKNVNLRLQVQTIRGGNENGFNLRVARPQDTDATFQNGGNGTNVSAIGTLPVNFGATGRGDVSLGLVPAGATRVTVRHFDSDVGVTPGSTISYSDGAKTYTGNPLLGGASDDKEEVDAFDLGSGYAGGTWNALYSAGGSDNSTWDLSYEGEGASEPGQIRLVE